MTELIRFPELRTRRLHLRAFQLSDAERVQRLAGEKEIAATTTNIPHPYEDGMAETWIAGHEESLANREGVVFAIDLVAPDLVGLVGAVGLVLGLPDRRAELGYWIGRPYWGRGIATEAATAVLRYGFAELGLTRIHAHHFAGNPASGRVLEKIGMSFEGRLRKHVLKWGRYEDLLMFGILKEEFEPD